MPTLEIASPIDHADAASYFVEIPLNPECSEFPDSDLIAAACAAFAGSQVRPTVEAALLLGLI